MDATPFSIKDKKDARGDWVDNLDGCKIFTDRKEGTSKMSGKIVSEAVFGVIGLKMGSWFKIL